MTSKPEDHGITGGGPARDRLIVCKALAYAITTVNRLPAQRREAGDARDMELMLDHFAAGFLGAEYFMEEAIGHIDGIGFDDAA